MPDFTQPIHEHGEPDDPDYPHRRVSMRQRAKDRAAGARRMARAAGGVQAEKQRKRDAQMARGRAQQRLIRQTRQQDLSPKDVGKQIQQIIKKQRYAHYGVRVDNNTALRVGERAPASSDWSDDDNPKSLAGTAAVAVADWKRVSNYSGRDLVLLGSEDASPGADRSEIVMTDAVVLGIWTLPSGFWGRT